MSYWKEIKEIEKKINSVTKFETEREYFWYIKGLKDAQRSAKLSIQSNINRYVDNTPFVDFEHNKGLIKDGERKE